MRLRQLFETKNSVAIIFGRFNPPHKGHKAAWQIASKHPYWYVGTNQSTQGPKDPLPYDVKIQAMTAIWPEVEEHIVAETSWLTLASKVYEEHGEVELFCLTDEDWVTKTIVQYNGKEGTHGYYNFPNIRQQATPRLSSATALRDAVIKGDREAFSHAAGVPADTEVAGHAFFDLVAHYLLPYQNAPKKVAKKKSKEPTEMMAPPSSPNFATDGGHHDLGEAPIEMDPSEPMNPMIYGHEKANPAKLQYRMMRAQRQLADLAQRAQNASPGEWQTISKHFDELTMNIQQIKHGLEELAKVRRQGGVRSRGIDKTIESAPKGWEGTVKAMKKHKDIDNPWALAHYMKNKGYKSHKKADGSDK